MLAAMVPLHPHLPLRPPSRQGLKGQQLAAVAATTVWRRAAKVSVGLSARVGA